MAITAEKIQSLLADLENEIQKNLRRRYALLQMTFLITTVQVI